MLVKKVKDIKNQNKFCILKYKKNKDMNEKYYVVFDGTSAYIVGKEEIEEIESDPFAIEIVYGPFNTFEEAINREEELNRVIGN